MARTRGRRTHDTMTSQRRADLVGGITEHGGDRGRRQPLHDRQLMQQIARHRLTITDTAPSSDALLKGILSPIMQRFLVPHRRGRRKQTDS